MSKFAAVFFDLDDTLWNSSACAEYAMEIVLPRLAPYLPEDADPDEVVLQFNAALLEGVREAGLAGRDRFSCTDRFERLLESYGLRERRLARELSSQYNSARRFGMRFFVRPNARHILRRLGKRGLTLGLITNGIPAVQRNVLKALSLDKLLEYVLIGEVEGYEKPDPRLFRKALELCGIDPGEMLYVGDSLLTDVLGAARAGVPVAWLRTRQSPPPSLPDAVPVPDFAIDDLGELLSIVDAAA